MPPLRVLYVDHTAKIGGGEIALFNLVRYLDSDVVYPIVVLFEDGPLAKKLIPVVETHLLALDPAVGKVSKDSLGLRSFSNLKAVWLTVRHVFKLARFARAEKVDLIHTNSLKADIVGGLAGRLVGLPVIWHVRDRIDSDYLPKPVVYLFRFLSRIIPKHIVANSEATLATLHLNPGSKRTAVPSGVVLREGDPDKTLGAGLAGDVTAVRHALPRIALIGRISPWKGQHIFLRAAAAVLERHPGAKFEIVGAALFAESAYEETLHALCAELGIQSSVRFVGFVENISEYVSGIDILVHASTTGEPFGQVIVEGMAEKKPVVATNGGGVPEIVVDGATGILVPMGDAPAMAKAIEYLLTHPQEARYMGRLGRERVLQRFTIQRAARLMEGVYEQVCPRLRS